MVVVFAGYSPSFAKMVLMCLAHGLLRDRQPGRDAGVAAAFDRTERSLIGFGVRRVLTIISRFVPVGRTVIGPTAGAPWTWPSCCPCCACRCRS